MRDTIEDKLHAALDHIEVLTERWKARNILLLEVSGRGDMLKKEHVNPDALDGLVAVQNEFDRLRNIVIRDLQSEVASLTRERDSLREALEGVPDPVDRVWCDSCRTSPLPLMSEMVTTKDGKSYQRDFLKHDDSCWYGKVQAALATPEENQDANT